MKQFIVLFCLLCTLSFGVFGQSISDCGGAIVLCGDLYTETQASFNTGSVYEATGTCNQGLEQSSVWYTFTVQADGFLDFVLTPATSTDDYDWGLFNITTGGCAGLGTTSPEVSCNSYGVIGVNGPTGISSELGGSGNSNGPGNFNGPPYNGDLPVVTGQTYALVVMNWTNSTSGYTIDFSGSTASLYDQIPPAPLNATIDCSNQTIQLSFTEHIVVSSIQASDFTITGAGQTYTASQVVANGTTLADTLTLTLANAIPTGGIYTLNITDASGYVQDPCGNLGTTSITFQVNDPISFDISTTTACNGFGATVTVENVIGGNGTYSLFFNGMNQPNWIIPNMIPGTFNAVITDSNGCQRTLPVTVPNQPIAVTIPLQDSLTCMNPFFTMAGVQVIPAQNVTYLWEGEGLSDLTIANPLVTAPTALTLTVTNIDNGCTASASSEIYAGDVYSLDLSSMVVPNVITKKSDGKNDVWKVILAANPTLDLTTLFINYDLTVYNRWGDIVFESTTTSKDWDAKNVSAGTYFYLFHYKTDCGTAIEETIEGTIQVIE